jgi:hypothetical protein
MLKKFAGVVQVAGPPKPAEVAGVRFDGKGIVIRANQNGETRVGESKTQASGPTKEIDRRRSVDPPHPFTNRLEVR